MKIGDLVWCLYHIYFLPKQGIIIKVMEKPSIPGDVFYEVLIEGETHTLPKGDIFSNQTDALETQIKELKVSKGKPLRRNTT